MITLTERQKQVARLVADGMSDKEIAEELKVTRATISSTLTRIYALAGLDNKFDGNIRVRLANMVREGALENAST
jgi:DNA-binding NarL/FixJ family response regulator